MEQVCHHLSQFFAFPFLDACRLATAGPQTWLTCCKAVSCYGGSSACVAAVRFGTPGFQWSSSVRSCSASLTCAPAHTRRDGFPYAATIPLDARRTGKGQLCGTGRLLSGEGRCPRNSSRPSWGWRLLPQRWKAVRLGPPSAFGAGILFVIPHRTTCLLSISLHPQKSRHPSVITQHFHICESYICNVSNAKKDMKLTKSQEDQTLVSIIVSAAIDRLAPRKTQKELAREMGFLKPGMLSMIKTGATRIPVQQAAECSSSPWHRSGALHPHHLCETWPEFEDVVHEVFGGVVTESEREWVDFSRAWECLHLRPIPTCERSCRRSCCLTTGRGGEA